MIMELTRVNAISCCGAVICFIATTIIGIHAFKDGNIAEHKPLLASLIFIGILLFNNTQNIKSEVTQ